MKTLVLCLSLVVLAGNAFASKTPYAKGQTVGQLGIGVGGLGGFYGSSNLPVLSLGLDFGIEKNISVGGRVGYTSSTFESPFFVQGTNRNYRWKYTYITIAGRGSYHYPIDNENVDLYGGIDLGYNIVSSKYEGDATTRNIVASASGSYVFWGVHLGGRYYFAKTFAAFAELGYGFGILNVGISMKL